MASTSASRQRHSPGRTSGSRAKALSPTWQRRDRIENAAEIGKRREDQDLDKLTSNARRISVFNSIQRICQKSDRNLLGGRLLAGLGWHVGIVKCELHSKETSCLSLLAQSQDGWAISCLRIARLQSGTPSRQHWSRDSTTLSESRTRDALRPGTAPDQTANVANEPTPVSTDIATDADAAANDANATPMILSPRHSGDSEETGSHKQTDATDRAEKAREDLKQAMMLRCEFKPGATGYWQDQNLNVSLFEWQGGPVTFEVVDLSAGAARMLGSDGATGSQDGVIDVMVAASGTGLHFSAFTPTRVLVVSTVFANLDGTGRYRAVMSRHGTPTFYGNISEQNYGSCDIGLSAR